MAGSKRVRRRSGGGARPVCRRQAVGERFHAPAAAEALLALPRLRLCGAEQLRHLEELAVGSEEQRRDVLWEEPSTIQS